MAVRKKYNIVDKTWSRKEFTVITIEFVVLA